MKDNEIRNAFETMTEPVHPEHVAEAVREKTVFAPKRTAARPRMTAFAAIAAAAVLTVSVGAYAIHNALNIEVPEDGPFDYYVSIEDDPEKDFVTLPEEITGELKQYTWDYTTGKSIYETGKIFGTWEEAAQWLDCGLLTSDLLGEKPENVVWGGDIVLRTYLDKGENIRLLEIMGTHTVEDGSCFAAVYIPQSGEWSDYGAAVSSTSGVVNEDGVLTLAPEKLYDTETMTHTTPDGIAVEITVTEKENETTASAHFYHEGIVYRLTVEHENRDEAIRLVKAAADSMK